MKLSSWVKRISGVILEKKGLTQRKGEKENAGSGNKS